MESHRSWYQPKFPSYVRQPHPFSIPREADRPSQRQKSPKVVQIPIQFFGSGRMDRSEATLRIQKVFRGFLVRKTLRRIKDLKKQVDEIEERLMTREVVELIRNNEKERLKMSEGLMSLLFKLDSVQGVDSGIRIFRKAVTRKAIMLQERVDSILNVDLGEFNEYTEIEGEEDEVRVLEEAEISNQLDNSVMMDNGDIISEQSQMLESGVTSDEMLVESAEKLENMTNEEMLVESGEKLENVTNEEMLVESGEKLENVTNDEMLVESGENMSNDVETETIIDVGVDRVLKVCSYNCSDEDNLTEDDAVEKIHEVTYNSEEIPIQNDGTNKADDWVEVEHEMKLKDGDKGDSTRNNELMDKLMKENEKMMSMMTHLFESNEKQMKMLTALSHRVEMLEKAFLCDVQRRRTKKKKSPGCGNE